MLKLDNDLLQQIGLGSLPEEQKKAMLDHIYNTLEYRVGTQLAAQMSEKQLEEFERFIDAGGDQNQAQALQWLETNLPNYKQVVNDVFEALKVEVSQMAPQLLASAQQQVVAQPQQPQYSATQPYQQPQVSQAPYPSQAPQQPSQAQWQQPAQQYPQPQPMQQPYPVDQGQAYQQGYPPQPMHDSLSAGQYMPQPPQSFQPTPQPSYGSSAQQPQGQQGFVTGQPSTNIADPSGQQQPQDGSQRSPLPPAA